MRRTLLSPLDLCVRRPFRSFPGQFFCERKDVKDSQTAELEKRFYTNNVFKTEIQCFNTSRLKIKAKMNSNIDSSHLLT